MSQTRSPRVTVVMPAYNAGRFIDEAIQSIRDQTLSDWELLIVNDGSTDNTADIAERHAKDDPRIRVLHQENAGQAAANNHAIPQARAELIARMDADDVSLSNRLALLAAFLDHHPHVVVVGTNATLCSPCGAELLQTRLPETDAQIRASLFRQRVNVFYNPTLMFRKSAWLASGGERACFGHAHDLDLCLRMVQDGEAYNLQQPTIRYRLHAGQVSTTATEVQATCALAAFLCANARTRGHEEPCYTTGTAPIEPQTLRVAGIPKRQIDEATMSSIVGMHERLCIVGDLEAACCLRRNTVARYTGTPAKARFAAAQCVMRYHEGKASPTLASRVAAWGAGVRHLPAALAWLGPRLCPPR